MSSSRESFPGLVFLVKFSPSIILPLLCVHGAFFLLSEFVRVVSTSIPFQVACYVLSIPAYLASRNMWNKVQNSTKAKSLGCVEVPTLKGRLPGNLDYVLTWGAVSKGRFYVTQVWEEHFIRFGPIWNSRPLGQNVMHTSHPEHMKMILTSGFQNFGKGKDLQDSSNDVLGTGIVVSDGKMWQFHRTMIRPFFARDRAIQYSIFEKMADKVLWHLYRRAEKGLPTDVQDLFVKYTFDSTVDFLFSMKIGFLDQDLPNPHYVSQPRSSPTHANGVDAEALKFAEAFEEAQNVLNHRVMLGSYWPLQEFLSNSTEEPMKTVNSYIYKLIEAHVRSAEELKDVEEEDMNLLDHMSLKTNDKTVWKDEIVNVFIAARDATAALITFVVYSCANHPNVLKRLRAEILDNLGPSHVPTFDDIKNMKYLRAVINETLRMYPPSPTNIREAAQDTIFPPVTPGGPCFYIPAKTRILYHMILMHRRKDLWGPDAQVYDPDRWLDERLQKYFLANPLIFLPFSGGPRICPGQQFAINEASFMIIRLLQKFENVELVLEAQPPEWRVKPEWADEEESFSGFSKEKIIMKNKMTLIAPGGVWVKFQPVPTA